MLLNIFFAEEFHFNPFCKARIELAKINQTNTIERPGRSTVFWKQKIRPDMDGASRNSASRRGGSGISHPHSVITNKSAFIINLHQQKNKIHQL